MKSAKQRMEGIQKMSVKDYIKMKINISDPMFHIGYKDDLNKLKKAVKQLKKRSFKDGCLVFADGSTANYDWVKLDDILKLIGNWDGESGFTKDVKLKETVKK